MNRPSVSKRRGRVAWFVDLEMLVLHLDWLPQLRDEVGLTTVVPESHLSHTSGFRSSVLGPLEDWRNRPTLKDHREVFGVSEPAMAVLPGIVGGVDDGPLLAVIEACRRESPELPPAHPDLERFWAPFARFRAAGLRVVAASDAGVRLTPIDAPAGMLSLLMHGFRLAGQDALDLLTREPADALGLQDRGRLEPGSTADVIGLGGDPTRDATALQRVRLVMRAGEVVWPQREVTETLV